jgi:molecular chaperone DnaK (HSP70)
MPSQRVCLMSKAKRCCRRWFAIVPAVRRQVGREAKHSAFEAPHDTIASVKRFMGRGPADIAKDGTAQRFGQYRFADPIAVF